ncbi:unnamed protein product, partial [Meganyctiphanes norvegica]
MLNKSVGGRCGRCNDKRRHRREEGSHIYNTSVIPHFPKGATVTQVFARGPNNYLHRQEREEPQLEQDPEEEDDMPYFDASMIHTYTAYLGKMATLTCIVHAAQSDKSV